LPRLAERAWAAARAVGGGRVRREYLDPWADRGDRGRRRCLPARGGAGAGIAGAATLLAAQPALRRRRYGHACAEIGPHRLVLPRARTRHGRARRPDGADRSRRAGLDAAPALACLLYRPPEPRGTARHG